MPEADVHQRVSTAADVHLKACSHELKGAVSSHRIESSLSFRSLGAFLDVIKSSDQIKAEQVFVGTLDCNLYVSVAFRYEKPTPPPVKKKRRIEEDAREDAIAKNIEKTIDRVRSVAQKTNSQVVDEEVLTGASQSLQSLLTTLKGPSGEDVVESWGLSATSASGLQVGRPSLILSMRLSAGMPVSVSTLRRSLGRSFVDGMLTTSNSKSSYTLPITEQGAATEREGQASMLLHASVAPV